MPEFRDPSHGDIFVSETELAILDTLEFQRLGRLYQLPAVHYAYRGATHTRFVHSLGVMELASKIFDKINGEREETKKGETDDQKRFYLRIAALLDDIDEPPFYPVFREFKEKETVEKLQEEIKQEKVRSICNQIIERTKNEEEIEEVDPEEVLKILEAKEKDECYFLNQIIRCELGADRLDYLQRDGRACGVEYGHIDSRILSSFCIEGNELLLKEEGIPLADSVFHSMYRMKYYVYDHKVCRAIVCMVREAFDNAVKERRESMEKFLKKCMSLDDFEFFTLLKKVEGRGDGNLIAKLEDRKILKEAFSLNSFVIKQIELGQYFDNAFKGIQQRMESEIEKVSGAPVYLDSVPLRTAPTTPIKVKPLTGSLPHRELREFPVIADWYGKKTIEQWKFYVFCEKSQREQVKAACEKSLGCFLAGREEKPQKPLASLTTLYGILESGEQRQKVSLAIRNKIKSLPSHELRTLQVLASFGSASAQEVAGRTKRKRSTESLILNDLVREELADKAKAGKRTNFTTKPLVHEALRELALT